MAIASAADDVLPALNAVLADSTDPEPAAGEARRPPG